MHSPANQVPIRCQSSALPLIFYSGVVVTEWFKILAFQRTKHYKDRVCGMLTLMWSSGVACATQVRSGLRFLPSGYK
ncbi:hypothetical protein E2C01_068051 [Portunus trituberculatus]|uniref:Uncharacterized protein n=1 Tax=Portunus trituberculatus TaxID=210409 RepID=A0A5B7HZ20_PORTR|nr:hypothetical protein [Portunus trituberculatus]